MRCAQAVNSVPRSKVMDRRAGRGRAFRPEIRVSMTGLEVRSAFFAKTVKRQRGNVCEKCSRPSLRLIADHIVERKDGGEDFDPNNIQCLCIGCHNAKTAKARAKRAATQARRLPR